MIDARFCIERLSRLRDLSIKTGHAVSPSRATRPATTSPLPVKEDGLMQDRRGHMTVLDRAGREGRSCECYACVGAQLKRVLDTPYG